MTKENRIEYGFLKKKDKATYRTTDELLVPLPPFPKIMLLELTNRCNHKCEFCFNSRANRKKADISENLLSRILKDAFQLGTREVGLYTTGEPFMFKNIEQTIQSAKNIGYNYVYMTTNGALATPDKTEKVIEAGLDSIKFSINAATKETYKLIHGKDDFVKVIKNLKFIRDFRDRGNIKLNIGVSFILTDINRKEKQYAEDRIGTIVDDLVFYEQGNQGGYMNKATLPQIIKTTPCSMIFNRFHVSCEGYFTLCCVDYQNYLAVADLNETSLYDAWASQSAIDMRNKHLSSNIEETLCYNCITGKDGDIKPLAPEYATLFHTVSSNMVISQKVR